LKPVVNKQDYLAVLRAAIWRMHNRGAVWLKTVHVHETFQGKTIWVGDVEIFNLMQHSKAKRCYAWELHDNHHEESRYVAVLEQPPVDSALQAVQATIIVDSK